MEAIPVRDKKTEGQNGKAPSPELPMSPSQVWICSPVRCPDSQPSAFSLFSVSFLVNEGIVLALVDTAQGVWRVLLEL